MATQPPQSLPSFAQAFGPPPAIPDPDPDPAHALPPILSSPSIVHHPHMPHSSRPPSRKRPHPDPPAHHHHHHLSSPSGEPRSPNHLAIKQESDHDPALPAPDRAFHHHHPYPSQSSPTPHNTAPAPADSPAPPPSAARPSPNKKRRVTISGISHPINTDLRPSASASAPDHHNGGTQAISPVVMGLPIPRDDPAAIEQVRSMLSIKQQQKDLIESRRNSVVGPPPPSHANNINISASPAISVSVANAPANLAAAVEERLAAKAHTRPGTGSGGRSPITTAPRKSIAGLSANPPLPNRALSPLVRPSSPPQRSPLHHTPHIPSHALHLPPPPDLPPPPHTAALGGGAHQHALPPPPISFARRRATRQLAGGIKGKPADIMISPRDAAAMDRLAPSIQSAPPIPRAAAAQGMGMTGRFGNMALPSLPPVLGPGQSAQRMTASRVPPTPTRLSVARNPAGAAPATATGAGTSSMLTPTVPSISGTATAAAAAAAAAAARSPPTASVPIASSHVPPTPAALHAPGYTGEKAAFLAPFEMFYDALADSRALKQWLAEQLQRSQALAGALQRQTERIDELVAGAVERRLAGVREEVGALRGRVEELEWALGHAVASGGSLPPGMAAAPSGLARTASGGAGQTYSPGEATATKGKAKANGIPHHPPPPPPPAPAPSHHSAHAHHHSTHTHLSHAHAHAHAHTHTPVVPESYRFPPAPAPPGTGARAEPARRAPSPTPLDAREGGSEGRSFPGSPVPGYAGDVGRRLSVSAIRLDPRSPALSEGAPAAWEREREREWERDRERERERERERGAEHAHAHANRPGTLPPPPSAAPSGAVRGEPTGWNRPWSPRAPRASLPGGASAGAARSPLAHGHGHGQAHPHPHAQGGERPGMARRASAQRGLGGAGAYGSPEDAEGRERERERERDGEREARDREREASPPPRREADVRSPEPMEE